MRLQKTLEALRREESQEQAWSLAASLISDLPAFSLSLDAAFFSLLRGALDCKTAASEAFISELILALLKLNPKETTTTLIDEPLWLNRLDSRTLTDTCLALVTQTYFPASGLALLSRLIDLLNGLEGFSIANARSLLCEYVEKCDLEGWADRLSPLTSAECIQRLFSMIEIGCDYKRVCVLDIAKAVISTGALQKTCGNGMEAVVHVCLQGVGVLVRLLEQPCSLVLQFPLGETLERLGPIRLRCVELLSALMALPTLAPAITSTSAFRLCTDLFFDFEWHSLLHRAYFTLLQGALAADCPSVAQDSGLPQHLVAAEKEVSRAGRRIRPGNYGYIVKIADFLVTSGRKLPLFQQALQQVEGWGSFISDVVQPRLDIEGKRDFSALSVSPMAQECPIDEEDECEYELKDEPEEGNCSAFTDSAYWKVQPPVQSLSELD
jgi:hypothetical protein